MIDLLLSPLSFLIFIPLALGAVAENGVLGTTRGKVGNVVFSTWKGINTVRAKVDPANPQTQAQQDNRSDFGNLAVVGSDLNVPLLQPYWGWLADQESPFNTFVRENMPGQGTNLSSPSLTVAQGELPQLQGVDAVAGPGSDDVDVQWSAPGGSYDNMAVKIVVVQDDFNAAQLLDPGAVGGDGSTVVTAPYASASYYPVLIDDSKSTPRESIGTQTDGAFYED